MERNFYCALDGKWYSKIGIVRIIKKFGLDTKEYYDNHFKKEDEGICKSCSAPIKFKKFGYRKFCSTKCSAKCNNSLQKMWDTSTEDQKQEMMKKAVKTRQERYTKQSMHEKRMKTIEEKYGMTYREFGSRKLKSRFERMSKEEKEAFFDKATENSRKSIYKYHEYLLNGKKVRTQGYEKFVLDVLKNIFKESDIKVDQFIKIDYFFEGKKYRYYPDIIVENRVFEVKSMFTFENHKEKTLLKMEAAKNAGYIPYLVLWDPKNSEMCEKDLIETISSQVLSQEERFNDYPFIGVGNKQMIAEVLGIHS